jgi:hypothetical protein
MSEQRTDERRRNRWEPLVLPEVRMPNLPTLPSGPRPEKERPLRRRTRRQRPTKVDA